MAAGIPVTERRESHGFHSSSSAARTETTTTTVPVYYYLSTHLTQPCFAPRVYFFCFHELFEQQQRV